MTSHPAQVSTATALAPASTASASRLSGDRPSICTIRAAISSQRPQTPEVRGSVSKPILAGPRATPRRVWLRASGPAVTACRDQGSTATAATTPPSDRPTSGGSSRIRIHGAPAGPKRSGSRQTGVPSSISVTGTGTSTARAASSTAMRSTRHRSSSSTICTRSPGSSISACSGPSVSVRRSTPSSPAATRAANRRACASSQTAGKSTSSPATASPPWSRLSVTDPV